MISLEEARCNDCRACFGVCPDYVFAVVKDFGGPERVVLRYPEQCCACGHCIAVCPAGALSHPDLPIELFQPLPAPDVSAEALETLILSRRSIRHFKPACPPEAEVRTLLGSATHGGTSSNGQTEGFIVITDRGFLLRLERLVVDVLWNAGFKYLGGNGVMQRLFAWRYGDELTRQYRRYHDIFQHRREDGVLEGVVFRNAPLVIVAHGLRMNHLAAANASIALRNIELLSVAMGLGTCWVGFLVGAAATSKKVGHMLGLPADRQVCGALMVGYPDEEYRVTIPRKPRDVRWI